MMGRLILTALIVASTVLGSPELLERNFAYRSPYANQPGLSLDTHSIHKRQFQAGEQIRREHHHLARKRDTTDRDDQGHPMPEGEDGTYLYTGVSAQIANHGNAPYVYAGELNFTHSVASGDPYDSSVLLWTRVEPVSEYELHIPMCVRYKVYDGKDATGQVVSEGYALTNVDVDFTIKVEAEGLQPGTWYWYQFTNCVDDSSASPVGRTKTAPGYKAREIGTQRFSVFSCSNFPEGFFSAYSGPVLHDDTDYVIHLGDYIYEYGSAGSIGRNSSKGRETATLDDYRKRYAQYRTDQDLVEMHRLFPIIAIWDDHETANNDWKAGSSNSNDSIATGGCAFSNNTVCFTERAINAKRAYHEWIPLRQVDLQDEGRIWREFNFGNLIDLFALDTRKYDRDVTDVGWNNAYIRQVQFDMESDRSITGMKQERWLLDGLHDSQKRGSHWRLLLNQVQFGSCDETFIFTEPQDRVSVIPTDSWSGYQAQRLRIIREIYENQIDNIAIVTGDSHSNWMYEITESTSWRGDPDPSQIRQITETSNSYQRGQIVEYAGTAVSSNGWGARFGSAENATAASARGVEENGALLYSEGFQRGYMHLAVNYTHLVTTYFAYPGTRAARVPENRTMAVQFVQENGYNQVQRPLPQPREGGFGAVKPGN